MGGKEYFSEGARSNSFHLDIVNLFESLYSLIRFNELLQSCPILLAYLLGDLSSPEKVLGKIICRVGLSYGLIGWLGKIRRYQNEKDRGLGTPEIVLMPLVTTSFGILLHEVSVIRILRIPSEITEITVWVMTPIILSEHWTRKDFFAKNWLMTCALEIP